MEIGYTRQSAAQIITGATILAAHFNNEYNQLASAFDNTTGHTHDGSVTGTGGPLNTASLSGLTNSSAGLIIGTGSNAFTTATITGTSGTITVTNGTGVSGNPTITIDSTYVGQATITTLGTIGTGVWHGSVIGGTYGGTGINNGSNTITLGGNVNTANSFTTSGNFATTLTVTGATNVTLPTSGTLITTGVTSLSSLTSASSLATIGTITSGIWNGTTIAIANGGTGSTTASAARTALGLAIGTDVQAHSTPLDSITSNNGVIGTYGGTGVNNGAKTITLGGNLTTSGAFNTTLTVTAGTSVTLPTSGTLVGSADSGTVTNTMLAGSIANSKLATMAANTVKVNATAGSATPTDIALTASTYLGRKASGNIVAIPLANVYQLLPSDPAGTTSGTAVMMGLAGSFTPSSTGIVTFEIFGDVGNAAANGDGAKLAIYYGTGAAPANGDPLTGTQVSSQPIYTNNTAAGSNRDLFHISGNTSGAALTVGTTYWFDLAVASNLGGSATVKRITMTAREN